MTEPRGDGRSAGQAAEQAIRELQKQGFEAYLVGGCVRDCLLGNLPEDYDIATNARPEQIREVFCGHKTIETGMRHGTVTVLWETSLQGEDTGDPPVKRQTIPLEITTYRIEEGYTDHRRPDRVFFAETLKEDLARRDFTINAMAYAPAEGVRDYFGGQSDLQMKVIRAVGCPEARFCEDGLRILRALRFAAVLDFRIEQETERALFAQKRQLRHISRERIFRELIKLLMGKGVCRVLTAYADVLTEGIPGMRMGGSGAKHSRQQSGLAWKDAATVVARTPQVEMLRMAALLCVVCRPEPYCMDASGTVPTHGVGQKRAESADRILRGLHVSNAFRTGVVELVRYYDVPLRADRPELKRWMQKLGAETVLALIELKKAGRQEPDKTHLCGQPQLETIREMIEEILQKEECYRIKDLKITGSDLKESGQAQGLCIKGKTIGALLNALLDAVIEEKVENTKASLLEMVPILYRQMQENASK